MASLVDEETASEFNDIGDTPEDLQLLRVLRGGAAGGGAELHEPGGECFLMQKLSFKLKEDKGTSAEKYGDNNKNVQLSFCNIGNEIDLSNSLHDLKVCAQECTSMPYFSQDQTHLLHIGSRHALLPDPRQNLQYQYRRPPHLHLHKCHPPRLCQLLRLGGSRRPSS